MFLKVIFLHLTSALGTRWSIIVQSSDDFLCVSFLMISRIWILGSLISSNFVIKYSCSIGFFLMSCFVAFHCRSYGTFFLHKNRLHNIHRGFTHYKYYRAGLFCFLNHLQFFILKSYHTRFYR